MKESKSSATKTRRLEKSRLEKKQNVKILKVKEDEDIDSDIVIATKKRKCEVHTDESITPRLQSLTVVL